MSVVTTDLSFDEFFRREYRGLVALGAWLTGDVATGDDLAQETLGRAHRRWNEVAGYERPGAFARRALVNLASNERRRRGRESAALRRVSATPGSIGADGRAADHDPELWAAVAALPFQQRAAIALRYLEDLPTPAVADALGCSEATVRVHLHRAHQRLAEELGATTRSEEHEG